MIKKLMYWLGIVLVFAEPKASILAPNLNEELKSKYHSWKSMDPTVAISEGLDRVFYVLEAELYEVFIDLLMRKGIHELESQFAFLERLILESEPSSFANRILRLRQGFGRYYILKALDHIWPTLMSASGRPIRSQAKEEYLKGQLDFAIFFDLKPGHLEGKEHSYGRYYYQSYKIALYPQDWPNLSISLIHELAHHWDRELYDLRHSLEGLHRHLFQLSSDTYFWTKEDKQIFSRFWFLAAYEEYYKEIPALLASCQYVQALVEGNESEEWSQLFSGENEKFFEAVIRLPIDCHDWTAEKMRQSYGSSATLYWHPQSEKGKLTETYRLTWLWMMGFRRQIYSEIQYRDPPHHY